MNSLQKILLTSLTSIFFFSQIGYGEIREIHDLKDVANIADEAATLYGKSNVLIVFDLDNTLIANKSTIGSDQWFEWQAHLIKDGNSTHAIATTTEQLYSKGAILYSISPMRKTQSNGDKILRAIQNRGFKTMALTARGQINRDATLRELSANGFDFSINAPLTFPIHAGPYLPLNPKNPEQSGLSRDEVLQFKLSRPRKISYEKGIMMVAGQHKGAMLRTVLYSSAITPKAIVFVDDKEKNLKHMQEALEPLGIEVQALRYSGEDRNVKNFHQSDKSTSIDAWQRLERTLSSIFPVE